MLVYTVKLNTSKGNQRIIVKVCDKATSRLGTAKAAVRVE